MCVCVCVYVCVCVTYHNDLGFYHPEELVLEILASVSQQKYSVNKEIRLQVPIHFYILLIRNIITQMIHFDELWLTVV